MKKIVTTILMGLSFAAVAQTATSNNSGVPTQVLPPGVVTPAQIFENAAKTAKTPPPPPQIQVRPTDSRVANPIAFCAAPKPCGKCRPWRDIYERICPSESDRAASDEYAKKIAAFANDPSVTQALQTEKAISAQMGPATMSAFTNDEEQKAREIVDWIKYQGNQVAEGKKVSQIWCSQKITNPLSNAQLRQMALNDINKKNQQINDIVNSGKIPPKDLKPWFNYQGQLNQACSL